MTNAGGRTAGVRAYGAPAHRLESPARDGRRRTKAPSRCSRARAGSPPGSAGRTSARAGSGSAGRASPTSRTAPAPRSSGGSPRCAPCRSGSRPSEVTQFYEGFSNGVLWPLFHYLLDQMPLHVAHWDAYVRVNERFADVVAEHYQPGDLVWVHDYQLMLRARGCCASACPTRASASSCTSRFPRSEVFRILPVARAAARGPARRRPDRLPHRRVRAPLRLGACCACSASRTEVDRVRRRRAASVQLGVFPMGVDAAELRRARRRSARSTPRSRRSAARTARAPRRRRSARLHEGHPAAAPRLRAAPRARAASSRERVRLVQVAVPSRERGRGLPGVPARASTGSSGRINGALRHAALGAGPLPLPRALARTQVVALYRAADVMLVTPLRDGMNLVAKEFVAARTDEDGVLVLSEFAGAADELAEALLVNPYDVDGDGRCLSPRAHDAARERRARMRALRRRVLTLRRPPLGARASSPRSRTRGAERPRARADRSRRRARSRATAPRSSRGGQPRAPPRLRRHAGPLRPDRPSSRRRTTTLLELLAALAARPRTEVHVVSGRDAARRSSAGSASCRSALHAEHGFWSRRGPGAPWVRRRAPSLEWSERCGPILEEFAARTPGSLVEEKTASLAWHYRTADPEFGARPGERAARPPDRAPEQRAGRGPDRREGHRGAPARRRARAAIVARARRGRAARGTAWSRSATTAPTRISSPRSPRARWRCTWAGAEPRGDPARPG